MAKAWGMKQHDKIKTRGAGEAWWIGSKIRAVSREINLQSCQETQLQFISYAVATSACFK